MKTQSETGRDAVRLARFARGNSHTELRALQKAIWRVKDKLTVLQSMSFEIFLRANNVNIWYYNFI